jgi:flagellar hook-basal body complex protein FliE
MSISGIEAIGAAMPAMPTMPTAGTLAGNLAGTAGSVAAGAATDAPGLASTAGVAATTGPTSVTGASAVSGAQSTSGVEFGNLLADGLDRLEGMQNDSSNLAVKAATGDLSSIHDYTIAAAEAQTATQLAVSLRNSGLQAFNQIMSMQV